MYKTDLIDEIAKNGGFKKNEVKKMLEVELEVIEKTLKKGDNISLIGFGSFVVKDRKSHNIINPATHQRMKIPAKKVVSFKPGVKLLLKRAH
jgi:DNA-binding protein HU-beta